MNGTSPCDFYQTRQQRRKARSGKPAILIHISANARADACGCPCGCGRTLAKDRCGCHKHQKIAADAFPAFEKYKVIESNPPCGCPMGCVAHCMGGRGFSAVSSPSLGDAFVLRNLALPRVDSPSGLASQTWPCHILGSHKGWFLRNRCLPHVDVLKSGLFHSSSCHACLGQASVSLGAPRMPTSLLHHGSRNRTKKSVETWRPDRDLDCTRNKVGRRERKSLY